MRILQLCTYDRAGGAERVALDLHLAYVRDGHDARMLVRHKKAGIEGVFEADAYTNASPWSPICAALDRKLAHLPRFRGQYRLRDYLRRLALPRRWLDRIRGAEDFNYSYSSLLLDSADWRPDIIHAHNVHGDYFDLQAFATLSKQVPVVWTLHDTWSFTGHCGYFINCQRWRCGCGHCPDLSLPPAVRGDVTASNWTRKREIYSKSRLAVATPSRWLMGCVEESMLQPWQNRVIPYGIDTRIWHPGDRSKARQTLGLPQTAFICIYVAASGNSSNPYKDYQTIDRAVRLVKDNTQTRDLVFVCVGEGRQANTDSRFQFTGYISDPQRLSLYYQAADVLLHAAIAENFPLVVLEALACGTPVIATAVGGIPEQVIDGETGFLVPPGDSDLMAKRILSLLARPDLCSQMGQTAARHVDLNYRMRHQSDAYYQWFDELSLAYSVGSV